MTYPRLLVKADEAAAMLSVSKSTLYRMAMSGRIRALKLGANTLYRVSDLEKLVDQAYTNSDLQHSADREALNKLQMEMLEGFWANGATT